MRNEDQKRKDPPQENDAGEQPYSDAKDDDLTIRARGLSDELVEGETLDVAIDPAKPR
jgi:hypothetical protein